MAATMLQLITMKVTITSHNCFLPKYLDNVHHSQALQAHYDSSFYLNYQLHEDLKIENT